MGQMRLDKYLAEMGKGSRSQIKQDVKKGLVQVNGQTVRAADCKVNPDTDQVTYAGALVSYAALEYYLLNKPAGYVSATEDRHDRTVLELIPGKKRKDLFPVGRLDKDTEGLLLITNDGELAHRLLHPKKHVDKTYYVEITGPLTEEMIRRFAEGVDIGDDTPTLPAVLKAAQKQDHGRAEESGKRIIKAEESGKSGIKTVENGVGTMKEEDYPDRKPDLRDDLSDARKEQGIGCVEVTLHEGRFHQIKRMFQAVGSEVRYLKRISMGPLQLDGQLAVGDSRPLTEAEKTALGVRT